MNPAALIRLTQAAYLAKDTIDRAHDKSSLETAFQAVWHFTSTALETPRSIQQEAKVQEPGIPVLDGLLRELNAATIRIACDVEAIRLAAVS